MRTTATYDENELCLLAAEGNEAAFKQLFYIYHNKLRSFVYRLTESAPLTQDIIQNVFLKIWLNRALLPDVECLNAYIYAIARNQTFNYLKQIARERINSAEWQAVNPVSAYTTNHPEEKGIEEVVKEGIEKLPPQQKKVYLLSRHYGLQQKEIAQQMNVSVETIKKHMVLALRFLKTYVRTHL